MERQIQELGDGGHERAAIDVVTLLVELVGILRAPVLVVHVGQVVQPVGHFHVHKIKNRKGKENEPVVVVANEEVEKNNYNISVNTYIKNNLEEEKIDIKEVNKNIKEIVKRENKIRIELDKIIQELEEDNE